MDRKFICLNLETQQTLVLSRRLMKLAAIMLSSYSFLKVLLLQFLFLNLVNCKCDSFGNVSMHVVPKTGDPFDTTVAGCIERLTFDEGRIKIREVYANKQQIQHIKKDAVKHLWNLRVLSFTECNSETIEEGAFRNVPLLATITLTYGHLKTIPIDVFNNLEELATLQLNNNEIESIDNEALAAISTLKTVNVSHNLLQVFNKNWFLNDVALNQIDFSHNKIQRIPEGAFQHLPNLTEIYFNDNALTEIQSEAFHGLSRLSILNLSNNLLIVLNSNSFHTNVRIEQFFIDANHLNFIASDVLSKIKIKQITLDGNPWKCACWDRLNYWVYQNNGSVESLDRCRNVDNIPNCIYPETFSGTCLEIVDEEATRTFFDRIRSAVSDFETFKLNRCVRFDD